MVTNEALSEKEIAKYINTLDEWEVVKDELRVSYKFKDSKQAFAFIKLIVIESDLINHHPKCTFYYNDVTFHLTTHSTDNKITSQDFELATLISNTQKQFIKN